MPSPVISAPWWYGPFSMVHAVEVDFHEGFSEDTRDTYGTKRRNSKKHVI